MKTYQDFLQIADKGEQERMRFILSAIQLHKESQLYKDALNGEAYYDGRNTTVSRVQKVLYDAVGREFPDVTSANHKIADRFFYRSVNQVRATLLGNGITWENGKGAEALGDIDSQILKVCRIAQTQGVCYGFFNLDHVEVFEALEFVPFYDEENGALKGGVRFWQIDSNKPLRATLFELDGYTEYIYENGVGRIHKEKRGYIKVVESSIADGEIYNFLNYDGFPIVPCFANEKHVSELNPLRRTIDAIDLISASYCNDIDECNLIYWTITNCGGMSDEDLSTTMRKLKNLHATQVDYDGQIQSHVIEPTFEGREAILDRLEKKLYKDAMALNTYELASGAVTATQVKAAYEPLNVKLDIIEMQITDFIKGLLKIAGVDDTPTYTRSIIINKSEEIQNVIASAMYLSTEYVTEKLLTILGDKDALTEVQRGIATESIDRFTQGE